MLLDASQQMIVADAFKFNIIHVRLSCGTSWHAASIIGTLKNSSVETKLANYGCQLYSTLEEETGLGTGQC